MRKQLAERYSKTRAVTENLCSGLENEDFVVQSSPEVSPPKWHLGHTAWFFDCFVLRELQPEYRPFGPGHDLFFNSYYEGVGRPLERSRRGALSRPTVAEIWRYRSLVDAAVEELLGRDLPEEDVRKLCELVELGIHHEQQHQELLLMDILHNFWVNPLRPALLRTSKRELLSAGAREAAPLGWVAFEGGQVEVGHSGTGFCFDHERPAHPVLIRPFQLASRLVTQGEFRQFVEEQGYSRPDFWLSDGWRWVNSQNLKFPLYWERAGGGWLGMSFFGMAPLVDAEPVRHLSYYEADAFARWKGGRLPTELEWECAAQGGPLEGNFLESGLFRPQMAKGGAQDDSLQQLYGDLWEWTSSAYSPYPGFRPLGGVIGEYNGKFMCNQMVLRGGSFATPAAHIRPTYRNFYAPGARWLFSGLRLASD